MPDEFEGLAAIDAEQQRPDPLAVVAPAKAAHDHIGGALFFDLYHGALARFVGALDALGDDAVQASAAIFLEPTDGDLAVARYGADFDGVRFCAQELFQAFLAFCEGLVKHALVPLSE